MAGTDYGRHGKEPYASLFLSGALGKGSEKRPRAGRTRQKKTLGSYHTRGRAFIHLSAMSGGSWRSDALADCGYDIDTTPRHKGSRTYQTAGVDDGTTLLHDAANQCLLAPPYYGSTGIADGRCAGYCFAVGPPNKVECCDAEDDDSLTDSDESDTEECHDGTDDGDDEADDNQCGVAPPHTAYAHGYTFIEGFMPANWFDALVRPERRLVLLVCGVPVAVDAAEVERAARVDRALVTPLGSCRLGPTDAERAHEVDESLYGREGIRRALAPVPLAATLEAVGAPAAEAAGGVGGAVLGGILAALL